MTVNNLYNGLHHDYPVTKELASIFLFGPDSFKNDSRYSYIPRGSADILNEHFNLTKEEIIPKHWPGILFNETSNISIEASNSPDLQSAVRNNYNARIGKFDDKKIRVEFLNSTNPNLFLSLKHVIILNPQIKNGYFTGILFDKYDFEWKKIYFRHISKERNGQTMLSVSFNKRAKTEIITFLHRLYSNGKIALQYD